MRAAIHRSGGVVVQGAMTSGCWTPSSLTARAMTTAVRSDEPVTALVTQVTYQAVITVLDGSAVVWRDLYGPANRAQHHQQADVGTADVTINKEQA
jgi:hypothetical protein